MFDRAKSVLATMSKTGLTIETDQSEESLKEQKILLTETMATLLKPQKDEKLVKVYTECFLMLTKHHFENESLRPFVTSTYKELLKKFLGGRCASNSSLSQKFFQEVFEQVPVLGWSLFKPLLKCFLGKDKETEGDSSDDGGSRSNHQRL